MCIVMEIYIDTIMSNGIETVFIFFLENLA